MKRAFTLIEILIVVAILTILSAVILGVFRTFDESQALARDSSNVVSVLERARQLTLFSKDSSQYGVHFGTDEVVLFKGTTYATTSSDNVVTKLHKKISISNINLIGGGSDVIFKRLSGETDQSGTTTLQSKTDATKVRNIFIDRSGLIK